MIGFVLAAALTGGMALLGVVATGAPRFASGLYGVRAEDAAGAAWVRAAGLRDLGLALALAAFLVYGHPHSAAVLCIATGLIAVGDLANVVGTRGPRPLLPLGTHLSGIVGGLLAGALLFLGI